MKSFYLMLGFFTKIPVPYVEYSNEKYKKGIKFVPLIGLLTGLLLYGISFLSFFFEPVVMGFILTISYLIITGGIHLDGMADSCDGLFSGRDREKMLEIMRDSRIGSYGVISLIIWFMFTVFLLGKVSFEVLIIMPMVGKTASLLSGFMGNYARKTGLGKVYTENCKLHHVLMSITMIFTVSVILLSFHRISYYIALMFIFAMVLSLIFGFLFTKWTVKKIGGITGDTLGFVCEVCQAVFLAVIYVTIWR